MLLTSKTDVLSQCYILAIFWKSWSPAPAASSRKRRKEWKEIQLKIEIQTCTKYLYLYLCISCLSVCICICTSAVSVCSHRFWGSIFLNSNFLYLWSRTISTLSDHGNHLWQCWAPFNSSKWLLNARETLSDRFWSNIQKVRWMFKRAYSDSSAREIFTYQEVYSSCLSLVV